MNYSIIEIGGEQQVVEKGTLLSTFNLGKKENEKVEFSVVFSSTDNKPNIKPNTKAYGKVIKNYKGEKIKVLKYKNKNRYHKKNSHRQNLSLIKIIDIK